MTNRLFLVLLLCLLSLPCFAQATRPAGIDPATMEKANTTLLQRTIDRQHQKIAELKSQIASLTAQLKSLGVEPTTAPTSQALKKASVATTREQKPKRVAFILFWASVANFVPAKEIILAVNELDENQLFNVITVGLPKPIPFAPQFVPANGFYKHKLATEFKQPILFQGNVLDALEIAAKGPADVIWLSGALSASNEDLFIREMKKRLKSPSTHVNTSLKFAPFHPIENKHLMWRVAKETGGVCLGEDGEPIEEPTLPPPPAPEPERKSILKTQ